MVVAWDLPGIASSLNTEGTRRGEGSFNRTAIVQHVFCSRFACLPPSLPSSAPTKTAPPARLTPAYSTSTYGVPGVPGGIRRFDADTMVTLMAGIRGLRHDRK